MRFEIEKIILYKIDIELSTEFNSSSMAELEISDNPLVRDTNGSVILRGESLAGLIRQELIRYYNYECLDYRNPESEDICNCSVCLLMGHSRIQEQSDKKTEIEYNSSRIRIKGGDFSNDLPRIRHGVAIERNFQIAAHQKKYDIETLMPGATAGFEIELENPAKDEEDAIDHLLAEMKNGLISLGGRKGSGMGGFTIHDIKKHSFDVSKREGVIHYLLKNDEDTTRTVTYSPVTISTSCKDFIIRLQEGYKNGSFRGYRLMITFDLRFPENVLVNDPLESALIGSDHVFVRDKSGTPWLPPSSIRGVFRNRAEQILRTLNLLSACDPTSDNTTSQLCSCSKKIEDEKKNRERDDEKWPSYKELEDGSLLCMGCRLFGSTFYGSRIRFQSGEYRNNSTEEEELYHFLAIDRFTGGGKEGAKYDALPACNITFADCKLIIEDFESWHIGLLALVFKDLVQNDMRFGFGSRKGFGLAEGSISNRNPVILSTKSKFYTCGIEEITGNEQLYKEIKMFLGNSVSIFRIKVEGYEGTNYDCKG